MIRWFCAAGLLLWLLCGSGPGAAALLPELDASSPAATLNSFAAETQRIEALHRTYEARPTRETLLAMVYAFQRIGAHLFDLSEVPPATRLKTGNAAVGYLADILLRLPELPPGAVPDGREPRPPAHWTIPGTEIRLVRLTAGPRAGDYVFSAATVARLHEFHAQAESLPILRASTMGSWVEEQHRVVGPWLKHLPLNDLPRPLQAAVLGTPAWKVIVALVVAIGTIWATLAWRRVTRRWTADASLWRQYALRLTVPALLAALILAGHVFLSLEVVLSSHIANAETLLATFALYVAAAWAAWCACWLLVEAMIASPSFSADLYDAHLMRIVAWVCSLAAVIGLLLYGANDVGVPALGLLAGVSIGGIALALAAQSTVENLFGGVAILTDRPFRVGDQIRFGASSGTVETIGPRSTRIRSGDGALTTVPNADLAKAQIVNVSARPTSLFLHEIRLPDRPSAERVQILLEELRRRIAAHPLVETAAGLPRVRLTSVGGSEAEIALEVFARIQTTSTPVFLEAQEALLLEILRGAEACGVGLASPTGAGTPIPG